ncbi:NERD domain-containing protein [Ureibacillus sp. MALMAid1270]|uniref:NERD domain-containing protein n=1 Tax=Ureibacillus sp. MALMAid1270 TaxID=3411629 RepID=UPI003BA5FB69
MILLERTRPNKLAMLEALLLRLYPDDPDFTYFKESYYRQVAGYEGENRVDREWFDMLNLGPHYLLFNYEYENELGNPHQIDTLLLTTKFILIVDAKNVSGQVDIDEYKHQMLVTKPDGSLKSYSNPIDQVKRHSQHLNSLLNQFKIPLPIAMAVVFSNPATIIGNVPKNFAIFHASGLRFYVYNLLSNYPETLSEKQLKKLSSLILSKLKRKEVRPTISLSRIRRGVLCEICDFKVQMIYKTGNWQCPKCGVRNKNAIRRALNDYRLLISDRITNKEFREFFDVESIDAASKLLIRLNLKAFGEKRGRYYIIPENIYSK